MRSGGQEFSFRLSINSSSAVKLAIPSSITGKQNRRIVSWVVYPTTDVTYYVGHSAITSSTGSAYGSSQDLGKVASGDSSDVWFLGSGSHELQCRVKVE